MATGKYSVALFVYDYYQPRRLYVIGGWLTYLGMKIESPVTPRQNDDGQAFGPTFPLW